MHALGHPLAEVRMSAIEALGRLAEPLAAGPLAQCALTHAQDVTQGMAVIRSLAALHHDASWRMAVISLMQHPARAVAAAATELLAHAIEPTRTPPSPNVASQVRSSIDDFANHGDATELIMALGEGAVTPLRGYLREGAQVIPQGRLFAASMLARLQSAQAREGLREVLHGTRLHDLPLAWQDAEYQVKDSAIRLLLMRIYPERLTDVIYAVTKERLPSAIARVGELGLSSLAPALVGMLEDDVLERAAGHSLKALGMSGQAAILRALPALFENAQSRVRGRLALIRALLLLDDGLHTPLPLWPVNSIGKDAHPAVQAAVALFAGEPGSESMKTLVRGALSDCPSLASACRERLVDQGLAFVTAALEALRRNAEPDIYGNQHSLGRTATRWLVTEILKASQTDACAREAVMASMAADFLAMGLATLPNPTEEFLRDIERHPSSIVRRAVADVLSRSGTRALTEAKFTFRRWSRGRHHHSARH
jgi:hypothetical protein